MEQKKLFEQIENNPELKAKIDELGAKADATAEDFIDLLKEYGVEAKKEDLIQQNASGEVSDDELDAVSGGQRCGCVIGGGGKKGGNDGGCTCIAGGVGNDIDHKTRCVCAIAGGGSTKNSEEFTTIKTSF